MAVVMQKLGSFVSPVGPIIGRIVEKAVINDPGDHIRLVRRGCPVEAETALYAAVLTEDETLENRMNVGRFDDLSHLEEGDLVLVDGKRRRIRTLYRRASPHNALFLTGRCNSNCLMCSQPPSESEPDHLATCLRMVELLRSTPPTRLGITGGEPTLLGDRFVELLAKIREVLPETYITALSNGRNLADYRFISEIKKNAPSRLRFTVPLHADVADVHDYVAQARGAFQQTLEGLYNLAAVAIDVEIRVVLHGVSVPRLPDLAEFVYRKLPFVRQVAFMGLEHMGYAKKNSDVLTIGPSEFSEKLREAVLHLHRRGIPVSIYNLPFCSLPEELWGFARQSISDHKQIFPSECCECDAVWHCAGFFASEKAVQVKPIRELATPIY